MRGCSLSAMMAGMKCDVFPNATLGYCTNVHAGLSLDAIKRELETHAVRVRALWLEQMNQEGRTGTLPRPLPGGGEAKMGVGLWFPHTAAVQLIETDGVRRFRDWLDERGLFCFTLNGFPYGDFHSEVVKHAVYEPGWADRRRYEYTRMLATILAELLPDDVNAGTISTLPLGWPAPAPGMSESNAELSPGEKLARYKPQAKQAAGHLTDLVHQLARIELNTGKQIRVCLEPEPGCLIDTAAGFVKFFEEFLLLKTSGGGGTRDEVSIRGYLGVCHDVCHSAVMFEGQAEALETYRAAGVAVGKVQVSSAVRVDFDGMGGDERAQALSQLRAFAEDRYLHQTVVREKNRSTRFFEDLPGALRALETSGEGPGGAWRVHFHVPVFAERFGAIETTQSDIAACLNDLRDGHECGALEVETYAWNVLPGLARAEDGERPGDLAAGIARELQWVRSLGCGA